MLKDKKKLKGFTLIELLAIIVILAIIAVITVPIILNVIENSKLGAAQDSSYGYKDAIENFYVSKISENPNFKLEDGTYTTTDLKNMGLSVSGKEPSSGEVTLVKGKIESFFLQYDKYECNYPVNGKVSCSVALELKITNLNLESTSNSITATVIVSGRVKSYEYTLGDETYTSTSNVYTFTNLDANTDYEVTVKAIGATKDTVTGEVKTKELGTISSEITPSGYALEKQVNMEFDGTNSYLLIKPSTNVTTNNEVTTCSDVNTCEGDKTINLVTDTWYKVENSVILTVTNNTSIFYKVSDGVNYTEESSINVVEIDRTAPTISAFETTKTDTSITVTASGEDLESNIGYYQYSSDGGTTWTEVKTSNIHTFDNLITGDSYDIKVKVINNTYTKLQVINELNSLESETITIKLIAQSGDAISFGGYNWHLIREFTKDGVKYQTLAMDYGENGNLKLPTDPNGNLNNSTGKMNHCKNDLDVVTDCGVDSTGTYYVYSWDKSLIQTYLNTTFYNSLSDKDKIKIVSETVCNDPSISSSSEYSYGGYLKSEIDSINSYYGEGTAICSSYDNYKVRLITASEYYNISPYYASKTLPYSGVIGSGNNGKVSKIEEITRISRADAYSWLYGLGWTMGSLSNSSADSVRVSFNVNNSGGWDSYFAQGLTTVRPVITITK